MARCPTKVSNGALNTWEVHRDRAAEIQLIEHAQRCLALDASPLARASAKRPYKLNIHFPIGYLHTTYHATEEEAHAAYKVMLEVFGDTAIDVERSGDVERVWKEESRDIAAQAFRTSL